MLAPKNELVIFWSNDELVIWLTRSWSYISGQIMNWSYGGHIVGHTKQKKCYIPAHMVGHMGVLFFLLLRHDSVVIYV